MSISTSPEVHFPPPSAQPPMRDHIFVSYAHKDRAFVERLASDLRDHGYTVWIDFEGIHGGDVWRQSIVDGINASLVVLLAISPDAVLSEWVNLELQAALQLNKKIIPLLVRPLETDHDLTFEAMHYILEQIQYIDFTASVNAAFDNLLADLPRPKAGIRGHCDKIVAQLSALPWGLDHYIQSEARLLPIDASPYEDGVVKGIPTRLMGTLHQHQRMIVLGEPGMGKTVSLQRLAWELAKADPPIIPVFIPLFEYTGQPLLEEIYLNLRQYGEIKHQSLQDTHQFLMDERYHCHFLLDGLNEVRPQYRETILREIRRLAMEYPHHRLVVTSRVQDDGWRQLRRSTALGDTMLVQRIHPAQAQTYLAAHLEGSDGATLWNQLDDRMRQLATTPLMLWLIKEAWLEARLHQPEGFIRIPDNRGELYRSFVTRMLRRDNERRLNENVTEAERLAALEYLALAMHEQKSLTLACDTARDTIPQPVIDALLVNGLLRPVDDQLRFAPHQTIQEHFAARALQSTVMSRAQAKGLARWGARLQPGPLEYARDPWWAETFIQLAGLTDDPNALARAVATYNPWLAWWCVQEGRAVDEATRDTIRAKSEALVRSSNAQDRRRAAEALSQLQTERVIGPLAQLSFDSDSQTARTALFGLLGLGEAGQRIFDQILATKSQQERAEWGRNIASVDPRPGTRLNAQGVPDIVWCEVPAGSFVMGGDPDAANAWAGAEYNLPYTFWIAKYPITYAQYELFVAAGGYHEQRYWTKDGWQDKKNRTVPYLWNDQWHIANHPVVGVTWYEAYAYTRWLNEQNIQLPGVPENYIIRLPRECEWEKAARYPDDRLFPWGNEWNRAKLNSSGDIDRTTAVGLYPQGANLAHGACDLSGNVWEWCLTEWSSNYASPDAENNHPEEAGERVARGGSWDYYDYICRAAARFNWNPGLWDNNQGFRVCCSVPI